MQIPSLNTSLKPPSHIRRAKDEPSQRDISDISVIEDSADSVTGAQLRLRPLQSVPPSNSNNSNDLKRRSFLPQPGEFKYVPRRPDATDITKQQGSNGKTDSNVIARLTDAAVCEPDVQSSKPGRLRPRSTYQTNFDRDTQGQGGNGRLSTQIAHPQDAVGKYGVTQSSGLGRSQSLRKPGLPAPPASSNSARSHVRTQSTSTATGARNTSTELRQKQERPKSLLVPHKATSKGPTETMTGGTKLHTRTALTRSTSTKSKPEATEVSDPARSAARPESNPQVLTAPSKRRDPPKEDTRKQVRPAFSTLQQHFTPRKTGKAPTSTFLHPPIVEVSAHTIPPELASLQAELLQLHLFHDASAESSRQWEISAKKTLRRKFEEVVSLHQAMRENERQGQEQKNIRALSGWTEGNSSLGLMDCIQILSSPLHELPSIVGPGGRFTRNVAEFDQWSAWVEKLRAGRDDEAAQGRGDLGCAEGLGDAWRAENAALTRKLTSFSRELERLTQHTTPASGSSIACMVSICKELVSGILEELRIVQLLEMRVVATAKDWVEVRLKAIAQNIEGHVGAQDVETWRMH